MDSQLPLIRFDMLPHYCFYRIRMILQNAFKNFIRIFYKMSYLSQTAINQNADKKDESYEKLVIAKIGVSAGVSETEIVRLDV